MAIGTTIKEIRPSKFKRLFKLPLPPLFIQNKIIQNLKEEEFKIENNKKEIEKSQKIILKKINSLWEI